jgi:PPP family 3-phenylpropionic acid transporter
VLAIRLSAFYAGYFLVIGTLTPFWPVFLKGKGMNAAEIGLLLSLTLLARVLASPVIARIAERTGRSRAPALVAAALALLISLAFFAAEGFVALLAVSAAAFFAFSCLLPLGESLTLDIAPVESRYGRIRLWGSLSFIVSAAAGGHLLDVAPAPSAETILALVLATLLLALVGTALLPERRQAPMPKDAAPLRALLAQRRFALMLGAMALLSASHTVYYGFATLHWQQAALSNTLIGLFWAEGVVAEIVLFGAGAALAGRLGPAGLLALAGLAGAIRWPLTALTAEPAILAFLQLLHAGTFGAMHLGVMLFIGRFVPRAMGVSAQGAYAAAGALATGLGLFGAGWLYGAIGESAFHVAGALAALGLAAALMLSRLGHESLAARVS